MRRSLRELAASLLSPRAAGAASGPLPRSGWRRQAPAQGSGELRVNRAPLSPSWPPSSRCPWGPRPPSPTLLAGGAGEGSSAHARLDPQYLDSLLVVELGWSLPIAFWCCVRALTFPLGHALLSDFAVPQAGLARAGSGAERRVPLCAQRAWKLFPKPAYFSGHVVSWLDFMVCRASTFSKNMLLLEFVTSF